MKCTIRDELMGSGKTVRMIEEIDNSNLSEKWIVVVPFLSEVERYINSIKSKLFYQPLQTGDGKLSSFHQLVSEGKNIVTTHANMKNFNMNTLLQLAEQNYHLVIDEELEVVSPYNAINKDDLDILLDAGRIVVDGVHLTWCGERSDKHKYSDVQRLVDTGSLLLVDDTLLMWEYNPLFIKAFKSLTILTYNFEGTVMSSYLKYHDVGYTIESDGRGVDLSLLNVYKGYSVEGYGLSVSSVKRMSDDVSSKLKISTEHFFKKHKASNIMWACVKDGLNKLKGKGYTKAHTAINLIGVNDYIEVDTLAYLHNHYEHPYIVSLFSSRGCPVNQDVIAYNVMVQWVFRSTIRLGNPINIYIPSSRMRGLLFNNK